MRILLRKSWADIIKRQGRTLLAILSIMLGVLGITAVNQASDQLGGNFLYSTDPASVPNIVISTNALPASLLTTLAQQPGIEKFQQRSAYSTPWQIAGRDIDHTLSVFAFPDNEHIQLWPFQLVQGHLPGAGEIVLDVKNSMEGYTAAVGDSISVQTPDGHFTSLRVVGLSRTRGFAVGSMFANPMGYMSVTALQQLATSHSSNSATTLKLTQELLVQTPDGEAVQIYDRILQQLRSAHIAIDGKISNWNYSAGNADAQLSVAGPLTVIQLLSGISLLLVCVMLFNSVTTLMTEQIKIVGTMKALGGARWRIIGSYLLTIGIYSIFGTVLGLGLGLLLGYQLAARLASLVQIDIGTGVPLDAGPFQVSAWVAITSLLVGLLVPLVSGLWPLWNGTRITVREAISAYGVHTGKTNRRDLGVHAPAFGEAFYSLPQTTWLGLRSLFRKPGRTALTLLALTLSSAIFLAVQTTNNALSAGTVYASPYHNPDLRVDLNAGDTIHAQSVVQAIRALPNVSNVIPLTFADTILAEHRLFVTGVDPAAYHPRLVAGRWLQVGERDALVLSEVTAQRVHLKVGQLLTLQIDSRGADGQANVIEHVNWRLVGLIHDDSDISGSADTHGFLGDGYATWNTVNAVAHRAPDYADRLSVSAYDKSPQALRQLQTQITGLLTRSGLSQGQVLTIQDLLQGYIDPLPTVYSLFYAVAILVALVGLLSLALTLTISVLERRMEIGILRSLGATSWRVGTVFWVEGLTLAVLAWALGTIIGIPGAVLLVHILNMFLGPHAIPFQPLFILISLGFMLVVTLVASFGPALSASRLRIREVLHYE
ncbi:MAG TPA: ABC transporter permease [Ktedonobacteraceae bacterium]